MGSWSPRPRSRRRRSPTPRRPRAPTTTPCSPAMPAAHPGVLSSSFKVVFDKTAPDEWRRGRPRRCWRAGQVNLAWPAAGGCALGRRRLHRAPRERRRLRPRRRRQRRLRADRARLRRMPRPAPAPGRTASSPVMPPATSRSIGAITNVTVVDKTAPLAPTKLTSRARSPRRSPSPASSTFALHWVKPDGGRPRPHRRRPQPQARPGRAGRRQDRLPRPRKLDQDPPAGRGRTATSPIYAVRSQRQLLACAPAEDR